MNSEGAILSAGVFSSKWAMAAFMAVAFALLTLVAVWRTIWGTGFSPWMCLDVAMIGAFATIVFLLPYAWLMDVVRDCGDSLVVSRGRKTTTIALDDIGRVRLISGRAYRMTIFLERPCSFGQKISFVPRGNFRSAWGKSPVTERLLRFDR